MYFHALTDDFLDYQKNTLNNSAGEMDQKVLCLRNHLVPFFGTLTFDRIERRTVLEYVAKKRKSGLAVATINHHLTILRRYLNHVEECGYMKLVPEIRALKMPRRNESNFLTPEECQLLYQAADRHRRPGWRLMMIVATNTGMRIGEMLALDWKDVDLKSGKVLIKTSLCRKTQAIKTTKNGQERYVSLTDAALRAFKELNNLEDRPTQGSVMKTTYDTAQRAMRITSKRANLGKEVTWHTLRHTFATALVCKGQPLYVVAKLLGHSSVAMAERYTHLTRDRSFAAIRELDGVL